MTEGFANPIIGGGGALVYPSIHSPNFVPGIAGWSIDKNGAAQFDDLIINGNVTVTSQLKVEDGATIEGPLILEDNNGAGSLFSDANGNIETTGNQDSLTYRTGHAAFSASAVPVTSTGFTNVLEIPGLGVSGYAYHIHGYAVYHRGSAAGTPQFSWGGALSGIVVATAYGWQEFKSTGATHTDNGTLGQANGPVFSGSEETYAFDVTITISMGGTLAITAAEGTGGDSWTVDYIFAVVEPC